jgi:factor associated with neutral sphingomyelinase activation
MIKVEKMIEVPLTAVPRGYTSHKCKKAEDYSMEFECLYDKIGTLYKGLHRVYEVSQNTGSEAYTKYELDVFSFFNDIRGEFVFDKTRIKNLSEKALLPQEMRVKQILPLESHEGLLYLTNKRVYFQPYQTIQANPVNHYNIKSIRKIFKRRYMLMRIGLEFWTEDESIYLTFKASEDRDLVYDKLMPHIEDAETEQSLMHYTEQWVKGEMSNFDYLMKLNYHSYRSRSDLTQYPVFPWLIQDYKSYVLDLSNEDTFRDLSKPMGALNEERLAEYKKRYNEIPEGEKYLFGTHYSAPGYVIGYLFRKCPRWMIKFQGGHFDNPNRLFKGIALEYESCLTNPGNVKELIPEFFEPEEEEFLINSKALDLGIRANGERVDDVILPKWADSPRDFLEKQREALECEYVSSRLHLWIDLIFGRKQRSLEDNNLFHPLTYEGAVDLEKIEDPFERYATEQQINEFGQTPRQLFRYDHPQKFSTKPIVKSLFIAPDEIVSTAKLPSRISVHGEEVKQAVEEEEYKEIQESDEDETPDKSQFNASKNPPRKVSEKKISTPTIRKQSSTEHEVDNDPTNSFLKTLKFHNMESLGRVHNSEIMELSAIVDKSGETHLMIVSKDGLIKLYQEEGKGDSISERFLQRRSFFVSERGITCSCVLNSQESVVIGTADNNIILFNFSTGTDMGNFYAHDNDITTISVIGNNLISFSIDTTLKIWSMSNSDFAHPKVFYDHEEAILSADVCKNSIISIDANGVILIRDVTKPGEIETRIELNLKGEDYLEHAIIRFNKADPCTFFLVWNDSFYVYEKSGVIINEISLDDEQEIDYVFQHKDCILIAQENGVIICYDWHQEKHLYKIIKTKGKVITAMNVSRDTLFVGTEDGEIVAFKS